VTFKAYENATTKVLAVTESLTFDGMQTGTVANPYILHAKKGTGISSVSGDAFNIYPNPVRNTMYISGDIDDIQDVMILATNGKVIVSPEEYTNSGINVASLFEGVYVVAIRTSEGYFYKKILKVN